MNAVLVTIGLSSKKHSGVISEFRKKFIHTGKFPASFSDVIRDAFDTRIGSDYDDFYILVKEDVERQVDNAKLFLFAVKDYLATL